MRNQQAVLQPEQGELTVCPGQSCTSRATSLWKRASASFPTAPVRGGDEPCVGDPGSAAPAWSMTLNSGSRAREAKPLSRFRWHSAAETWTSCAPTIWGRATCPATSTVAALTAGPVTETTTEERTAACAVWVVTSARTVRVTACAAAGAVPRLYLSLDGPGDRRCSLALNQTTSATISNP